MGYDGSATAIPGGAAAPLRCSCISRNQKEQYPPLLRLCFSRAQRVVILPSTRPTPVSRKSRFFSLRGVFLRASLPCGVHARYALHVAP